VIADRAASLAGRLLEPLGSRWQHTQKVAERARRVSVLLDEPERDQLLAEAYLHDIGYAPELVETGAHQIDGARYVRSLGHERLAGLVAHHSCASYEAEARGLRAELDEFPNEDSRLTRLLTYCDMTTGPTGSPMTLDRRLAEIEKRYGPDHFIPLALSQARPTLESHVGWVEAKLRSNTSR